MARSGQEKLGELRKGLEAKTINERLASKNRRAQNAVR